MSLQLCQILTDFNNFEEKMYQTGHAFSYLLLKENVANDTINVSLFARPVKNRSRITKVIVKNKMSRFYGSLCI